MQEVTVIAPATVSNVVCGFDCLGFALAGPFDELTLRLMAERTVRIRHRDKFGLPTDPQKNVAGVALLAMIKEARLDHGFEIEIRKGMKPGSGIGSSAASACAAVVAANRILDDRFSELDLVRFAIEGELVRRAPVMPTMSPPASSAVSPLSDRTTRLISCSWNSQSSSRRLSIR